MIPDKEARDRALDISISFIVQAPAGSGKTELLIQRYLKLLEVVDSPDAVVAITFTRKAAAEMRARVIEALHLAERGAEPASEHSRLTVQIATRVRAHAESRNWKLLHNPSQMRIETIDALCAAITRRMPWLSRFGAMPAIAENAEDLYREAARNTLRRADDDDAALACLLLHLDNDFEKAESLIREMLQRRDQWLRHTGANPDFTALRATLEKSLETLIAEHLRVLRESFNESTAAEISLLFGVKQFPEPHIDHFPDWRKIADLLLTAKGEWRRQVNQKMGFPPGHPLKSRCEQLLARLPQEKVLLENLQQLRELPPPKFSDAQWQAMQAAVSVLTLAVAELQMVFRARGRVDFAELAIRASDALGRIDSPTDLALALGHRIQHLLIDEFQDTSYTQFELVEKLTAGWEPGDGRTLFLVGDPMQSIYRFRQADVSLFLKASEEGIGSIQPEPLTLSVNFRSTPDIVAWVNRTFEQVLPGKDDIESGAVAYSPTVSATTAQGNQVSVHAFLDPPKEAERVLDLINDDRSGEIAILVRARSHLAAIVQELRRHKIPFQAIEIDQLGERAIVQDLMALTFALLHAADRVSWLAVLRAPWCGLTLSDLNALAGSDPNAAIPDLLSRAHFQMSADGALRVRRILDVIEPALAERGRHPLRDWVEGVWRDLGGPVCAEDDTAIEDAYAYFDLLEGLESGADLADFEWFREQVGSLFAQPSTHADQRLQLMTIHKAKGLEFDTVIVPGLGSAPRRDEARLLWWLEQRGELLIAPISESGREKDPIYAYLNLLEQRKNRHEAGRLLYVAATRARKNLHLLGSARSKEDGSILPLSGSLLELLWSAVSDTFSDVSHLKANEPAQKTRTIRRIPSGWVMPAPPPPFRWSVRALEKIELPEVTFDWANDWLRHTGTALHAFLQRIAREGLNAWDEDAVRSRRKLYEAMLANLGVLPVQLGRAAECVEAGLLHTLRDPRGRWILGPHADAQCELALAGLVDGKLCEGVLDRTFTDEAGVRWIIDYKTSAHQGGDLENFIESEGERYRAQLERYARLMFQREGRPIRLGLYFPLLSAWREWAAPVLLRKQASLFEF